MSLFPGVPSAEVLSTLKTEVVTEALNFLEVMHKKLSLLDNSESTSTSIEPGFFNHQPRDETLKTKADLMKILAELSAELLILNRAGYMASTLNTPGNLTQYDCFDRQTIASEESGCDNLRNLYFKLFFQYHEYAENIRLMGKIMGDLLPGLTMILGSALLFFGHLLMANVCLMVVGMLMIFQVLLPSLISEHMFHEKLSEGMPEADLTARLEKLSFYTPVVVDDMVSSSPEQHLEESMNVYS